MSSLGGFRLVHRAGGGTLGDTYLAVAEDGRYVAVKALHPGWGPPRTTAARAEVALAELQRLGKARDTPWARCVRPLRVGYDDGAQRAWIATPWLTASPVTDAADCRPAVSLSSAVAVAPLPAEAALYLLWQLTGLIRDLHAHGLSLAGLKPSNVFLTGERVFVADVHIALTLRGLLHEPEGRPGTGRRAPLLWADPDWLAPELRRSGSRAGRSSSVYAVGALLSFACTGRLLFPTTDLIDALTRCTVSREAADALAAWASKYGNAGARARRAVRRSLRHRRWARPSTRRLRWLSGAPLWSRRRLVRYQLAWTEYLRTVSARQGPPRESAAPGTDPDPRTVVTRAPAATAPARAQAQVPAPAPAQTAAQAQAPAQTQAGPLADTGPARHDRTHPARPDPTPNSAAPTRTSAAPTGPGTGSGTATGPGTRTGPGTGTGTGTAWQPLWSRRTGGPLLSPPALLGGQLLVTCGGTAQLLDAHTGELLAGLTLRGTAESRPVRWGGRLWFAQREGLLSGYDLQQAGHETHLELDGDPGPHSPVVLDETLLVGTTHGLFRFPGGRTGPADRGERVLALDEPVVSPLTTDSSQVWVPTERRGLISVRPHTGETRSPLPGWDSAGCTPVTTPDGVCVGDAGGTVHCLDFRGTSRRRWEASAQPITAPPVLYGDVLLVIDHAGVVMARSVERWEPLWRTATDADGRSAPAVHDGVVYVCGADRVRCLDVRSGAELRPLPPDGTRPVHVTVAQDRLHVGLVDGRLTTWRRTDHHP
ncbi:PQQ-binding-like beta-propeller repeat protein [Streptomyces mangrovisoli]|uniref:Protein kinase domain-containing protein n=1 Tax=Streptomyces mangrovisoli TaxID=1428628 RepID=A0A1J4NLC2_9ACTN|nr:PQQ-binding-like beta-propeller repeat protein [Streptomyces mangrovisoli]OIJ63201.1 hypothetical protein WN71_035410 [Streptomyces mangrovisoli]